MTQQKDGYHQGDKEKGRMGDPADRNIRHGASPFGKIEARSYSRLNPWYPISFSLTEGPMEHKGGHANVWGVWGYPRRTS